MKKEISVILSGLIIFIYASACAQNSSQNIELNLLQQQARDYRNLGLEQQRLGNLSEAMSFYEKAIGTDPFYAVAYNDLGIVYEDLGDTDSAEESYLKSIRLDPNYPNAYSNLAFLYEGKRDFEKAADYWNKRRKLGAPDDPWRAKAERRLRVLGEILPDVKAKFMEDDAADLSREVSARKTLYGENDKELARAYFTAAKDRYNKGDYPDALRKAVEAQQLDQNNSEISDFVEKSLQRTLSR